MASSSSYSGTYFDSPTVMARSHRSAECKENGSGDCDGFDYDTAGQECMCQCHRLPLAVSATMTYADYREWHKA